MIQKSYDQSNKGKLYIVPTPIGNLDDITFRAIDVLKNSDIIFAEDTRETGLLLKKFGINKKLISCHKYSEEKNKDLLLQYLNDGNNIAYTSDRGTPLISDPGEVIVKYAIENNFTVISIPGASALLPALNMSNISNERFLFYGFLNSKESIRINELQSLKFVKFTIVFYEAPHRIEKTLKDILLIFGNRNVAICREISKMHEEIFRGKLSEACEYVKNIKGEIVIVIEGNNDLIIDVDFNSEVEKLINSGMKISMAIKEVSSIYNISKNKLYNDYMNYKSMMK